MTYFILKKSFAKTFCTCIFIVILASQTGRQNRRVASVTPLSATGTLGSESLPAILANTIGTDPRPVDKKRKSDWKQDSIRADPGKGKVAVLTKSKAYVILKVDVETIMSRYEPLSRLYDPFNMTALIISHPAIGHFIPRCSETIYNEYSVGIDKDCSNQLVQLMKQQPGLLSVACDAVTSNRKSKTLFTATIGCVSMFVKWTDHGSDVHVTDVEVQLK